jgi:hypothetical protein
MRSPLQIGGPIGPEVLAVGVATSLFLVLTFVMAYWVYSDAVKRGNYNGAYWALAVVALSFLTLVGGVVVLAVYVWRRSRDPYG